MKTLALSWRTGREIIRDPLNVAFGLGFPLVVLFLLTIIQSNVPFSLFKLDSLLPGVLVFGLSFVSLFSGMLIAKDRGSSLLLRLFSAPLSAAQFIMGYALPLLPLVFGQILVVAVAALCLGLPASSGLVLSLLVQVPAALLFIAIGLLAGSALNDRQVGGLCGAVLTNLTAWLSGTWFSLDLVGGAFKSAAYFLPFVHAVNAGRAAIAGNWAAIPSELAWVVAWAAALWGAAILVFRRQMAGHGAKSGANG